MKWPKYVKCQTVIISTACVELQNLRVLIFVLLNDPRNSQK